MIKLFSIEKIIATFKAGIYAPFVSLPALLFCIMFFVYLVNRSSEKETRMDLIKSILIALSGVLTSMTIFALMPNLIGLTLGEIIDSVSLGIFCILIAISIMLMANLDVSKISPKNNTYGSFLVAFLLGVIVALGNPVALVVLSVTSVNALSFLLNFLNLAIYGVGLVLPLLVLFPVFNIKNSCIMGRKDIANTLAGILIFVISVYNLIFNVGIFIK